MPDLLANPAAQREVYTPSSLTRFVRDLLEDALPLVWVEGEISNFSRPASGHLYFTLKDGGAQVRCAMFKPRSTWLRFKPADGMHVLARARLSLYEPRGDFQLIVEHLEEAGDGALRRAFEQLKQRLAAEGLFDDARKKPIPALPRRIGIVTSPTGAAVRDVLTILARRFPAIPVLIYPTPVQGKTAAPEIAFPADGVDVDLGVNAGDASPLIMKIRNGVPPFTFFANGAPIGQSAFNRSETWMPDGPGYVTLSVVDSKGRSDKVKVFID